VVSGPLETLDLQRQVDETESFLSQGDPRAVEIFDDVAERLKNSPYQPHATMMLRKRATALQAAGLHDEATIARIGLAWDDLDRVRVWEASWALNDSSRPNAELNLNASTERALAAAHAAVWTAKGDDLQQVCAAFDALEPSDPYRGRAAAFLAEEAIAADRSEMVIDRLEELRSIADGVPKSAGEAARIGAIRLRMCLADVTGEWTDLLRQVRRDPWRIVAWVEARYARYLALSGDGAGAMEHYLDAIEHATAKELFDDAADWLYALRTVRYLYGQFSADEQHPLAQALRPHAKPSTLPGSPHTKELALQAMLDKEESAEALQRVERWRWQSVVRAELTDELRAIEAVGTLQEKRGDLDDAIKSYVRAGDTKRAKAAAGKLPDDHPAHLDRSLLTGVSPMRAAAFAAAAAAADVLDDEECRAWAKEAIDEITQGETGIPITRSPAALRAFDVLAAMCRVLPDAEADSLLDLVKPIIESPAKFGWESWRPTAEIVLALSARPSAPPLLARAILADQRMAGAIIDRPDVLEAHRELLVERLRPFAKENRYVCLAIIRSGADPAIALELARAQIEEVLKPRVHAPNAYPMYMGAAADAVLASVLDQESRNRFATTMLDRAMDQAELKQNRYEPRWAVHHRP
jgi:hypothetical protein